MGSVFADSSAGTDRGRSSAELIREHARVLAGAAFVGLIVGAVVGGVLGRVAMRVLVLTSDDRLDGAITDDEAVVNRFTLSGTIGLVFFLALGGAAIAWLYVGARRSLPSSTRQRAVIWAALLWCVMGQQVFDPDGFDFTRLTPAWLGVLMFSVIFLAVGALVAIGVEWAIERWPSSWPAHLPFVVLLPGFPLYIGGVVAAVGAELSEHSRLVRWFGAAVMAAILVLVGPPVVADVARILS